ncbi:hypothetical protein R3P38DRAFT_2849749 [Favolaschia claudopus]|uniref:Uncharacterized protein n=1 Tax=Favolaschia claudopus TaxID=2862362 RepID=A0AAW0DU31_9AGAR
MTSSMFCMIMEGVLNPATDQYDLEVSPGRLLLPLSMCCRYLRAQTLPWIFREVYNWDTVDDFVWPETIWPFIRIINVRDRSLRNPGPIALAPTMLDALGQYAGCRQSHCPPHLCHPGWASACSFAGSASENPGIFRVAFGWDFFDFGAVISCTF